MAVSENSGYLKSNVVVKGLCVFIKGLRKTAEIPTPGVLGPYVEEVS